VAQGKVDLKPELLGLCGFYCGSCPTYLEGDCEGCIAKHQPGDCFTHTCVQEKGLRFCGECSDFPCDEILSRKKATVLDKEWLAWKRRQKEEKR